MKVSILVPVYNVEKYIGRCINSILTQSYDNIEVIIVNDCTPDKSMDIVNSYALKDARIKVVNLEKNVGLMRVRNVGVKAATGDYIMFCDSDDWLTDDAVEKLLNKAIETDADIVVGAFKYINTNGDEKISTMELRNGRDVRSIYKSLLKTEITHTLWGRIYKASLLKDYDYVVYDNLTNSEDKLLFYQVVEHCKNIELIDSCVYNYFINSSSATRSKQHQSSNANAVANIQKVYNILIEKFQKDQELLNLLEANIVGNTIGIVRWKSISPQEFLKNINLEDVDKLNSLKKLSKLFKGIDLLRYYILLNYYKIKYSKPCCE